MMDQAQREAIRKKAAVLAGEDLGEDGDALVEMAAQRACAHCQRQATPLSPMRHKRTPWYSWPPSGGWAG